MTKRSQIRKKLDLLVKDIVKKRDRYTCQHCHKLVSGSNCHVSHVIPVSASLDLAYDLNNLKVLCYHCHINWWHKNPIEAGQWFREAFHDRAAYLEREKAKPKFPIKDWQLEEMYNQFKTIKKSYET